jgi:hypothetical protein
MELIIVPVYKKGEKTDCSSYTTQQIKKKNCIWQMNRRFLLNLGVLNSVAKSVFSCYITFTRCTAYT